MNLTGLQRRQLQEALLSAFPSNADLAMIVDLYLNENLSAIAGGENLRGTVFNLITWAVARGKDEVLIRAALHANPGNPQLAQFAEQVGIETVLQQIESPRAPISSALTGEKRTALEDWLEAAQIDFTELEADRTKDFVGREWVFQSIADWMSSDDREPYLLIGGPGTGKSAIAFRLIQFSAGRADIPPSAPLPPPPFLTASHICTMRISRTLDPGLVARSLAWQLMQTQPGFKQALLANITTPDDAHGPQEIWNAVLAQPLSRLKGARILILIDSLDEAQHHPGTLTLVDLLASTGPLPGVRWLFTTRDEAGVVPNFKTQWQLDLIADAPPNTSEVRDYALRRLKLPPGILSPPARATLAEQIAHPDQGNFLYARHVLDDILPRLRNGEKLDKIRIPVNLADVYRQFLTRLVGHDEQREQRWEKQYRPLLGTIATAQGSGIPFRFLLELITGQTAEDVNAGLQKLRAYLTEYSDDGPYRLYHQSFADFLLDAQANPLRWIDPIAAHYRTADRMMTHWASKWSDALPYARRYTPTHLMAAIQAIEGAGPNLVKLLTDRGYLEARLESEGGSTALIEQDFAHARAVLPTSAYKELARVTIDSLHAKVSISPPDNVSPVIDFTRSQSETTNAIIDEDAKLLDVLQNLFLIQLTDGNARVGFLQAAGLSFKWLANYDWDGPANQIAHQLIKADAQQGHPLTGGRKGYTILGAVLAQMIIDEKVGQADGQYIADSIARYKLIDLATASIPDMLKTLLSNRLSSGS